MHIWAILSDDKEAESASDKIEQLYVRRGGGRRWEVVGRERGRECDGQRHRAWTTHTGEPCLCQFGGWVVRRMVWERRHGRWHGEWTWELYERDKEWYGLKNHRWCEMGDRQQSRSTAAHSLGSEVPQEVLL